MIIRLAKRELVFAGRKLLVVLFILAIGLIGPLAASALRSSVDTYLAERSKQMLSADFAISAMRPFKSEETAAVQTALRPLRSVAETEFITMSYAESNATALVEVKAEEPEFPIVGSFLLKATKESAAREVKSAESLSLERIAWVYPEVLAQLGINVGANIRIGKAAFRVVAEIEDAPGQGRMGGFAPRIYIGRRFVRETELTQVGSQVFHRLYLALPTGVSSETAAARIKASLQDPEIFLRTPDDAIQGFERFFHFFGLYLGAVSLIVFALSWTGAFYILQVFLLDRLKNAAIIIISGANRAKTALVYAAQILVLMIVAGLLAAAAAQIVLKLVSSYLSSLLPKGFVLQISAANWAVLIALTLVSSLAFLAPFVMRLFSGRLQALLGEGSLGLEQLPRQSVLLSNLPTVCVFLALSTWVMASWKEGLELAAGLAGGGIAGVLLGRALFRGLFRFVRTKPGFLRLIATSLSRGRTGMNLCFLALILVAITMNIVPHLLVSVVTEVMPIQGKEIPAFFLFNIPESQLGEMKTFAAEENFELRYLSPMVQGRLMKVNGEPTRSDQFQRFPVRLSYRPERIPSETLVEGHELPSVYDPALGKPAEVSVETRFAERNGFHLGDTIEFDIQGVPVVTRITSLRKVKWSGFNPNFFIMFQPGVLDDAPKTWLANVNVAGGEERKTRLQFELIRRFPDLSVIDIGRTISRILEIARSVIGPITAIAWMAVLMSFLILIGIIGHNLRLRFPEVDIEKLLGADSQFIRQLLTGEYVVTACFAWLVGGSLALVLAHWVVVDVLDLPFYISWSAVAISFLCTVFITGFIAWYSAGVVMDLRSSSEKL